MGLPIRFQGVGEIVRGLARRGESARLTRLKFEILSDGSWCSLMWIATECVVCGILIVRLY